MILADLNKEQLNSLVASYNEKSFRAGQIYNNINNGKSISNMTDLSEEFRGKLLKDFADCACEIYKEYHSKDGSIKYLFKLSDGNLIEGVLMKYKYGYTQCVSTQVGCRMGCAFCASGLGGLVRNLTSGEILAQVTAVNKMLGGDIKKRQITNLVLMGSGEPFDNYDNTVDFLRKVTCEGGLNISARNISLSTSGLVPQIKKFADEKMQVNLCISLHAPNDVLRQQIMPVAKKYSIRELIDAAKYFFEKTHRRVIFEYSLMMKDGEPFNCKVEQARELSNLVRGFQSHINLINLNPLNFDKNAVLTPPSREVAMAFMDAVIKSGVSCTMRKNKGDDIDGACGQLRLRHLSNLDN